MADILEFFGFINKFDFWNVYTLLTLDQCNVKLVEFFHQVIQCLHIGGGFVLDLVLVGIEGWEKTILDVVVLNVNRVAISVSSIANIDNLKHLRIRVLVLGYLEISFKETDGVFYKVIFLDFCVDCYLGVNVLLFGYYEEIIHLYVGKIHKYFMILLAIKLFINLIVVDIHHI